MDWKGLLKLMLVDETVSVQEVDLRGADLQSGDVICTSDEGLMIARNSLTIVLLSLCY